MNIQRRQNRERFKESVKTYIRIFEFFFFMYIMKFNARYYVIYDDS